MRHKNKTFPISIQLDGLELTESIISYLTAQFPKAEIEKKFENNTYYIALIQNTNLKKFEKTPPSQSKFIYYLISIRITDELCDVDIQSEVFAMRRRSPKDRLINASIFLGTVGVSMAFPAVIPYAMSGLVGASIVASSNTTEKKIFKFIKDYIN